MPYYDKWSDRNRRAKRRGEQDAERYGYKTCRHYDRFSECGAAYEDGFDRKRREVEYRAEERQHEEMMERRRQEEARQHRIRDEEYWDQQRQKEDEQEQWDEQERYREILFRKF